MKYTPDFSSRFRILKGGKISLVVAALIAGSTMSFAAPTGGQVTTGSATINQNGSVTTINQSSNKASINWNSFSIAPTETVNFVQPSSSSVTLNRVIGTSQSLIQGAMNANGQVFLINPNGVLFANGSQINVGGLVASTLNITDENFQAGNYIFEGNSQNSVLNMGTITANNGYVALMGKHIANEGTIVATMGNVQMASGEKISLNLNGNSLVKLTIDQGTMDALVENKGLIQADGGQVYLTTQALNAILDGMVNNTGIIEAQSLNNVDGKVILFAHGGTANIGGTIKAEGGFVETSGKEFVIQQGATIKAGEWLIDPVNITIDSTLAGTISTALDGGADVTITTDGSDEDAGDITLLTNVSIAPTNMSDEQTLTLKAHRSIIFEEGSSIDSTGAGEPLNVYLSANNSGNGEAEITLNNASIQTDGGDIVIGGALDIDGMPTVGGTAVNGVNVNIVGATLDASGGDITIGGDRIILSEHYASTVNWDDEYDYYDNNGVQNPDLEYDRTQLIGNNILLTSYGDTTNNSILIDATDFTVGNSLSFKTAGPNTDIGYGNISFVGDSRDWLTWGTANSQYQSIQSTITFTGGNNLTFDSTDNVEFFYLYTGIEGDKAAPILLNFSDAATVTIKTLQRFATSDFSGQEAGFRLFLAGSYDLSTPVDSMGYGTSTMWDGYMFGTAGFYDIKGGTVNTQMLSDGSVANGWARAAYQPMTLNNGNLAFGNGFNDSVNQYGLLRSPFYFDGEIWRQLTFADLPMSVVIGVGGDGTDVFNLNGSIVSSLESSVDFVDGAFSNAVLDTSGFNNGTGTIKATTIVTIDGQTLEMENTYNLPSGEHFIATDTKLTNTSEEPMDNIRLWYGVQDDYIAGLDWAINRTRGNLVNGVFVPTDPANYSSENSHALILDTEDSGVLFHTTSDNASAFITTYDWNNEEEQDAVFELYFSGRFNSVSPADTVNTLAEEGIDAGYGVFNRYANLANGHSDSIRWYYGADVIDNLSNLANVISEQPTTAQVATPVPTPEPTSASNTVVDNVVTTIVNGATVTPPRVANFTPPSAPSQARTETQKLMNAIMPDKGYELVSSPNGLEPVKAMDAGELQAVALANGISDLRVPLGNDSLVDLVNGGLNLPKGVNQEFYVVDNSSNNNTNRSTTTSSDDETNKAKKN